MSWVCHFSVVTPCYIHAKGYLMLHHSAGATIQIANLVHYNCHPQVDGNERQIKYKQVFSLFIKTLQGRISRQKDELLLIEPAFYIIKT